MRISPCFAIAVALASGCSKSDAPPKAGSGSAPGSAAVASQVSVKILVNDTVVATLSPKELAAWPQLDTLVPADARRMGTWMTVSLQGTKAKATEINRPSETYREYLPVVFIDNGSATFGMFDPVELAKKGKPALREDGLREIRIKMDTAGGRGQNEQGSGGAADPNLIKLTIKTPKGESILAGTELMALPREDSPPGDAKGWKLSTILTAAKITTFEKLVLTDVAGLTLGLERKDFDDKTVVPFVKLSRKGNLRVKVYKKQGEGWQGTGDLRELQTIEILK